MGMDLAGLDDFEAVSLIEAPCAGVFGVVVQAYNRFESEPAGYKNDEPGMGFHRHGLILLHEAPGGGKETRNKTCFELFNTKPFWSCACPEMRVAASMSPPVKCRIATNE
jgi:hypothetical protein